ncbi:MAG: septal ring lytic transglycosylase RlpA family protein [Rhodospirillales bacterium]
MNINTDAGLMGRGLLAKLCVVSLTFGLAACAETSFFAQTAKRVSGAFAGDGANGYKIGNPYKIKSVWYYPQVDYDYRETGIASWYGPKFHGRATANGEVYDMNTLTAAHRTLPMPSFVRVTNLENGRSLILRVNDRGPFAHNRIIDVSRRGAQLLGFQQKGTARVRVEIMANESRAIAAKLTGTRVASSGQTPIRVAKLPKASVASETLAPPPGAKAGAMPPASAPVRAAPERIRLKPQVADSRDGVSVGSGPTVGHLTRKPVRPTNLYVQAGAFSYFNNANQVKARLHHLGDIKISPVLINGQDLYRVRLGPFEKTEHADRFLESVIRAGYTNAHIVVE